MIGHKSALFHCSAEEREEILTVLRYALRAREDVLFAYVYGSFLGDLPFHDIDVGVYLASESWGQSPWLDIELAMELEETLSKASMSIAHREGPAEERRIPVDVRVLNEAPLTFRYHVLRGRLLLSRDEEVRVPWVVQTVSRYLDLKPLRDAALREAISSWA